MHTLHVIASSSARPLHVSCATDSSFFVSIILITIRAKKSIGTKGLAVH